MNYVIEILFNILVSEVVELLETVDSCKLCMENSDASFLPFSDARKQSSWTLLVCFTKQNH